MDIKKVLVLGATGLLGRELVKQIGLTTDWEILQPNSKELDITKEDDVNLYFTDNDFDAVINCAAFTRVDKIETDEGFEIAMRVNGLAPGFLAKASNSKKILFIHISTDYVFSDDLKSGYKEDYSHKIPVNKYGETKLKGEEEVISVFGGLNGSDFINQDIPAFIVRTSWLFGFGATNFISKMIELSKKYDSLKVVTDEVGCPTYVKDLSLALIDILQKQPKAGIYHVAGNGSASRFDFAKQIFKSLGKDIEILPTTLKEFGRETGVPHYSILLNTKLPQMRNWQEMVDDFIKNELN